MSTIGQEAADRAQAAMDAVGPEGIAEMCTEWAHGKGILGHLTEERYAELIDAFGAGFAYGVGYVTGAAVAREKP